MTAMSNPPEAPLAGIEKSFSKTPGLPIENAPLNGRVYDHVLEEAYSLPAISDEERNTHPNAQTKEKLSSKVKNCAKEMLKITGVTLAVGTVLFGADRLANGDGGPSFSQKELASLPEQFHRHVPVTHYAEGPNQAIEDSGIYAKGNAYNDVQEYVKPQLQHGVPKSVDVPDPMAYEAVQEYMDANNG